MAIFFFLFVKQCTKVYDISCFFFVRFIKASTLDNDPVAGRLYISIIFANKEYNKKTNFDPQRNT